MFHLQFIGNYQETIGVKTGWGAGEFHCSLSVNVFPYLLMSKLERSFSLIRHFSLSVWEEEVLIWSIPLIEADYSSA